MTTNNESHMNYFVEYVEAARKDVTQLQPPNKARANGTFQYLEMLYECREQGQAAVERTMEMIEKHRPEYARYLGVPAVTAQESIPMLDFKFIMNCLTKDEQGDAEMLAHIYKDRLTYDPEQKRWYFWGGNHWCTDRTNMVRQLITGQIAAQYHFAAGDLDKQIADESDEARCKQLEALRETVLKRATYLYRLNRVKNVLEMAQPLLATPTLPNGDSIWDSNSMLLGVKNGVIDLKTGVLRRSHPLDWIRKVAPTKWEGIDAIAERFEQFLLEIFDNDTGLVAFIQRLLGYGITGLAGEHILPILYGEEGRNGKDTLLETIAAVLGKGIAGPGAPDLIVEGGRSNSGGPTPHLVDLQGARLKWVSETSENARMNTNQVKFITGGGSIKGRGLHQNYIEFETTHLMLLITNHKPRIPSGGDPALWERLLLIPFNVRFVQHPTRPNERKRDEHLKSKLKSEASGILAWLVRGGLIYQKEGLNPPQSVRAATEEYQTNEDVIQQFISDCCVVGDNCTVGSTPLFDAFKNWGGTLGRRTFGERITKLFEKGRLPGKGSIIYKGIGLLSSESEG